MLSLGDILWGDALGNPEDGENANGVDSGVNTMGMTSNCLVMCCGLGHPCQGGTHGPKSCVNGFMGCK